MDDRTFTNNSQVQLGHGPSDLLKQFIEALVEEVVLNGEPFEAQKKWLRKYCEGEHIDSEVVIESLTEFFDNMEELKTSDSKAAVKLAHLQARECYISASTVDKLVEGLATVRANGSTDSHDYVDLGLPSGTLWKTKNELRSDGTPYFTFDEALRKFGGDLPTWDQFNELVRRCEWKWDEGSCEYEIVGPNGNSIILSGLGYEDHGFHRAFLCVGDHLYWTSDYDDSDRACYFSFDGMPNEDEYNDEDDAPAIWEYSGFYWGDRRMGCAVRTVRKN